MKKLTLLAVLAAASVLALPTSASAIWTHNHNHLVGNAQIHAVGNFGFNGPSGGIKCTEATLTMQLTGGTTTGNITQLNPNLLTCHTTGGIAHCKIDGVDVELLPYVVHITGTDIQPTNVKKQFTLSGFLCPDLTISGNGMTITAEENGVEQFHTTIQGLRIEGQCAASWGGNVTATGTFTLTPSSSHTYGFT